MTKLVFIKSGQILITVKRSPSKVETEGEISSRESLPLGVRKSSWAGRFSEAAILVAPSSLGEEYLGDSSPCYYQAKVKSQICETIEFDLTDVAKCLNISAADVAYFHRLSQEKVDHYKKPIILLPKKLPPPPPELQLVSSTGEQFKEPIEGQRSLKVHLAANRLLK